MRFKNYLSPRQLICRAKASAAIASVCVSLVFTSACAPTADQQAPPKIKALIIDGQNNHVVWPKSTVMMKQYLEATGLFEVSVYRTQSTWKGKAFPKFYNLFRSENTTDFPEPKKDASFAPEFDNYDVVISNFGWRAASWPDATKDSFEKYMKTGGGFVSIHAADNSFPKWQAYNDMIGIGGWGGRTEKDGPYVYYSNDGTLVRDGQPGPGGAHGRQHELDMTNRVEHPITRGMPRLWKHGTDECYEKLRGPAENMTVLATALCPKETGGSGRHEPMLMVIDYHQGRVFHSTLGHHVPAYESVGFIATFLRGTEWAATGKVTQSLPEDFPGREKPSFRKFEYEF